MKEATTVFKEMNLSQEQAQKLVDFHTNQIKLAGEAALEQMNTMRNEWRDSIGKDPVIGRMVNGKPEMSPAVKETLGRLYALQPPEEVANFKEALDLTGAGDHPGFLKFFYSVAKRLTEARPTADPKNPSPLGQVNPSAPPKSMANAMFPNLPSGQS